jgi:signal transduction histidine kinase
MKLLWPEGLAGRVAVLLALSLLAVQVISIPYYLNEQARTATEVFEQSTAERIASVTRLFDGLENDRRRSLLPVVNGPTLMVELFFQKPGQSAGVGRIDERLARGLSEKLRRPVYIESLAGVAEDAALLSGLFSSRELMAVWIALEDGTWLRFITASSLPSLGWVLHLSAQLVLVSLGIIAFAIWAARQITRPIRTFATAADRLGRDVNAPPIPEQGSRELRRATRAFNTMQANLQRYVEDRTRMLAAISHDLRTSLTRLRLRTGFIADEEQQSKAERDVEDMDAMLSATLAFARDDADREQRVRVDLASLLHSLCDDLGDSGHPIRYQGPASLPYSCRPVSLRRALVNLLTNAASYGEDARASLDASGQEVVIQVIDSGPGIPEAELQRVLEPFVRLDSARSRATGGTGLGLPIARSVIHAHGGTLTLCNRAPRGLQVTVQLPAGGL